MAQTSSGKHARRKKRRGRKQKNNAIDPCRLGWRIDEWIAHTGISRPTLWRQVKRGDLKLVYVGPMPMVSRAEAIRLGFIDA